MKKRTYQLFTLIISWLTVGSLVLASTITTIQGTDTLSSSRAVINTNFSNLNADKAESNLLDDYTRSTDIVFQRNSATIFRIMNTASTSVFIVDSISGSTTIANILNVSSFSATSTTATSTINGQLTVRTGQISLNGIVWKWPSADGSNGQCFETNGAGTISLASCLNSYTYLFTPTSNFGVTMSATSSSLFASGSAGFYASSTSILSTTTVLGSFNTGTLTATSGTSYLQAGNIGSTLNVNGSTTLQATNLLSATTTKLDVLGSFATRISSTTGATSQTIDWSTGAIQRIILQANTDIIINSTSSNPQDGGRYVLKLIQDSTGSRTVNFATPGQLRWWNSTTTIASTANQCTWLGMIYESRSSFYTVLASSTPLAANQCQ